MNAADEAPDAVAVGAKVAEPHHLAPAWWRHLPVTEYTVAWAYRLLLGREAENEAVLADHAAHTQGVAELRSKFMQSSEFLEACQQSQQDKKLGMEPPCPVQVDVDDATRARLLAHIAQSWTHLGKTEPYWSVVSEPEYRMQQIGSTREAFLDSGREHLERMQATFRRCGIAPNADWTVFELGCGLGRITRWLAGEFREVLAYDISASHLALAKDLNKDAPGFPRIKWSQLRDPADLAGLPSFDLFFSVIVLQHNPPPVIAMLLDTIASKLRPGGVTFFQVPTWHRDYYFDVDKYFQLRAGTSDIEMHILPQADIFRIFAKHGCEPLEVFEDELSGSRMTQHSNTFVFRKRLGRDNAQGAA